LIIKEGDLNINLEENFPENNSTDEIKSSMKATKLVIEEINEENADENELIEVKINKENRSSESSIFSTKSFNYEKGN